MIKKVAVILFNQGYPESLEAVKPFLFNIFYDPAFLTVSNPMRVDDGEINFKAMRP
jgi:ferrochelatase